MEQTKEPGITDYFATFRRRRWLLVGVALPIVVAAIMVAFSLPSLYRSTAIFRFETPALQIQNQGADARNNYLDAYVSKLEDNVLGPESLARLRDVLQLPSDGDGALGFMRKKIHVDVTTERILDPDSARQKDVNSGFTVYYDSRSPDLAQRGSQWLSDQFVAQSRQNHRDRAVQAADFLQTEADKYKAQSTLLESKLADFKTKHAGELPDSQNVTQGEKERAEADLINVEQELSTQRQNRIFLVTQLQQNQAVNPNNEQLRDLQDQYNKKLATYDANHPDMIALRRQINELQNGGGTAGGDSLQQQLETQKSILAQTRQRYSEDHPDVKRLERSIAALQQRIASGEKSPPPTSVTNPVAVQLQTQLNANDSATAALIERRSKLNVRLASIAGQVAASPQVAKDYESIVRDLQLARDKSDELLKRKMDSELTAAQALAGSSDEFHLLQAPGKALPSTKSKAAIAIIGIILATILGFGVVMIREAVDQSVRGSNDVISLLSLTPLAVVPEIQNSRYMAARRQRLIRLAFALIIGVPVLFTVIRLTVH
jgi:succinoglycan biosynthesis transport protein ExoP